MANRDPAFLFYPSDFEMGTMGMSYEQKGKYITLLNMQHAKGGYLKERDVKRILSFNDEEDVEVLEKFKHDENGYFNKRLLDEITKREEHREKQRQNINKRWHKESKKDAAVIPSYNEGNTKVIPLENENENRNENEIKNRNKSVFKRPSLQDIEQYCAERNNGIDAEQFYHFYEGKGWKVGNTPMKNWKSAIITWEKRNGTKQAITYKERLDNEIEEMERAGLL